MDNARDWVVIARFGRPHGVKGWITVISFLESADSLFKYHDWHIKRRHDWLPIEITELQSGPRLILAKVKGYIERESVAMLTNVEIAVKREQLPQLAPGEYYWFQLIGLEVKTVQGQRLGVVDEVRPTGSNDVLVVKDEDKRHLIPFMLGRFITDIDLEAGQITADWDVDF